MVRVSDARRSTTYRDDVDERKNVEICWNVLRFVATLTVMSVGARYACMWSHVGAVKNQT